jgi:hypothetical protein
MESRSSDRVASPPWWRQLWSAEVEESAHETCWSLCNPRSAWPTPAIRSLLGWPAVPRSLVETLKRGPIGSAAPRHSDTAMAVYPQQRPVACQEPLSDRKRAPQPPLPSAAAHSAPGIAGQRHAREQQEEGPDWRTCTLMHPRQKATRRRGERAERVLESDVALQQLKGRTPGTEHHEARAILRGPKG